MPNQQQFQVELYPSQQVLQYLATLEARNSQQKIVLTMTEAEYAAMPGADDIRKHIVADYQILEFTRQHNTSNLAEELEFLLKHYNEDEDEPKPEQKFDKVVDLKTLTAAQTLKALGAVARCTDENGNVIPFERSTSAAEALDDELLSPQEIFQ